jgi:hypothetical protein
MTYKIDVLHDNIKVSNILFIVLVIIHRRIKVQKSRNLSNALYNEENMNFIKNMCNHYTLINSAL